jgi:hypothetical protein
MDVPYRLCVVEHIGVIATSLFVIVQVKRDVPQAGFRTSGIEPVAKNIHQRQRLFHLLASGRQLTTLNQDYSQAAARASFRMLVLCLQRPFENVLELLLGQIKFIRPDVCETLPYEGFELLART